MPSFVMLGTGGFMTRQVFARLLELNRIPRACLQTGAPPPPAVPLPGTHLEIRPCSEWGQQIQDAAIPHHFEDGLANVAHWIDRYSPDYLLVACWPRLLPPAWLRTAHIDALNIHPSLLPRYRGIDPIGAMFNKGDTDYGVSLHRMTQHYDAGEVVAQQGFRLDGPVHRQTIEATAARIGAELFAQLSR